MCTGVDIIFKEEAVLYTINFLHISSARLEKTSESIVNYSFCVIRPYEIKKTMEIKLFNNYLKIRNIVFIQVRLSSIIISELINVKSQVSLYNTEYMKKKINVKCPIIN
jgi:hypothetical protein